MNYLANNLTTTGVDPPQPGSLLSRSDELTNYSKFNLFPDIVSAHRAALVQFYSLSHGSHPNVEFGIELLPYAAGTIKLGKVVIGDETSVQASRSDYHPAQNFIGKTKYPTAHSHTYGGDFRGFSTGDLREMLTGRPLGGLYSASVIDIGTGQGYLATLDSREKIPVEVKNSLTTNTFISPSDTDFAIHWIRKMIYEDKLRVTLITRLPNDSLQPSFSFQVNGLNNSFAEYAVPSRFIREKTK
jgi:hypothetical protein